MKVALGGGGGVDLALELKNTFLIGMRERFIIARWALQRQSSLGSDGQGSQDTGRQRPPPPQDINAQATDQRYPMSIDSVEGHLRWLNLCPTAC
jgi:hypothetical protein